MKPIFIVLTLLVASAALAGAATAQTTENSTATEQPNVNVQVGSDDLEDDPCREKERVDEHTAICSATTDGNYAELLIESNRTQRIVVTDAAGFMTGGEINRQRYTLKDDGPHRIRMRITTHRGFAGVTVDTGRVLYAVPLEQERTLIGGPYDSQDVQLSAIGGALSVAIVSIIVTIRAVTGRSDNPERIA